MTTLFISDLHLDAERPEIADQLKHSLSKVKTDIARGRETLRKRLEPRRTELEIDQ